MVMQVFFPALLFTAYHFINMWSSVDHIYSPIMTSFKNYILRLWWSTEEMEEPGNTGHETEDFSNMEEKGWSVDLLFPACVDESSHQDLQTILRWRSNIRTFNFDTDNFLRFPMTVFGE